MPPDQVRETALQLELERTNVMDEVGKEDSMTT